MLVRQLIAAGVIRYRKEVGEVDDFDILKTLSLILTNEVKS